VSTDWGAVCVAVGDEQAWALYDPVQQMTRMQIPASDWRVTEVNSDYKVRRMGPQRAAGMAGSRPRHCIRACACPSVCARARLSLSLCVCG
jgi:hypothetical protein